MSPLNSNALNYSKYLKKSASAFTSNEFSKNIELELDTATDISETPELKDFVSGKTKKRFLLTVVSVEILSE
jgi:hypothetical protein